MIPQQVDIKGYDGKYYITIEGEVFRRHKKSTRKLKPYFKSKRFCVGLTNAKGKKKSYTLNQLMKQNYFNCDNPNYGMYHKNGLEADCSYWNLKLISKSELGKITGGQSRSKTVLEICKHSGEIIKIYPSARKTAKAKFVSYQTIIDYCNGKVKTTLFPDVVFVWEKDFEELLYGGTP